MTEKFVLFNYDDYNNVILQGSYSYPFSLFLPHWLPQSHLCFNTPDLKKLHILNTFKVRFDVIAAIEQKSKEGIVETEKKGSTMIELQKMIFTRRITVITPEFSQPLLNQKVAVSSKVKSMSIIGAGTCSYVCVFDKDIAYPKDILSVTVDVDNSKCSKKIDKSKLKLLRRT